MFERFPLTTVKMIKYYGPEIIYHLGRYWIDLVLCDFSSLDLEKTDPDLYHEILQRYFSLVEARLDVYDLTDGKYFNDRGLKLLYIAQHKDLFRKLSDRISSRGVIVKLSE